MMILRALAWAAVAYLGTCVAFFIAPLAALVRRGAPRPPAPARRLPFIHVVAACRDGAAAVPGLVRTFAAQLYPADRHRLSLVADNCADDTADVARRLGLEVYERHELRTAGKGNAVTEFLKQRLRHESFDVLVVVDVDGRVEPDFLRRVAAYFQDGGAAALCCATYPKNSDQSTLARTGGVIQRLLRQHQEGREALGRDAVFYGSHGYALSREALKRIDFVTCTGLVGEDMECRMRSVLAGTPVRYGADLRMYNDVTEDFASSLEQRRRWNAIYFPLIRAYLGPLARQRRWDSVFGVLLLPGVGNLFLYLAGVALSLGAAGRFAPSLRPPARAAAALTAAHVAYLVIALRRAGVRITRRDLKAFLSYLGIKTLALAQGPFLMKVKDWAPAPHGEDR